MQASVLSINKVLIHPLSGMITHSVESLQQSAALPGGQSAWTLAPPCLAKEKTRSTQDKLNNVLRSDLLPLEVKWACICAGKALRFAQDECVVRNPGCCFVDECPRCSCLGFAEVQLSIS